MAVENDAPDDLRSLLSQSFDDAMSSTAVSDGVVKPSADAGGDDDAGAGKAAKAGDDDADAGGGGKSGDDRKRGEDGKFVKKDEAADKDAKSGDDKSNKEKDAKTDAKADADKDGKKAEAKEGDDKATDAKTDKDAKEPPARWSASAKAMFKLQPPEVQTFLLDRVAEIEGDYTKKTQAIADLKREYEPVQQLFAPYVDVLKQKGLTPQTVIRRWAEVETALAGGKGVDIIDGLVKGYGIDKAQLAQRLGFTSTPPAAGSSDQGKTDATASQTGADDPAAQMLARLEQSLMQKFQPALAKVEQFETQRLTDAQAQQKAREDAVEAEISSFKSATDQDGNPLHPYYDEVEPAMIALAQSYVASKQPIPKIDELYDQAVWANPSTRQALLATQRAAQEAKAAEEARAKAASARRAASSVTGAPGTGQATRSVRGDLDLRAQLEEAFAEVSN